MEGSIRKTRNAAICLIASAALLAGCAGGNNAGNNTGGGAANSESPSAAATTAANSPANKPDPVTLDFYLFSTNGGEPNNLQAVMDEFYKQTEDSLNIKINWHWTNAADIGNTVNLKLTAGEKVDGFFTAGWLAGLPTNQAVSKGLVRNLDAYFDNDQYPGLKKAFDAEYLNNNKFQDGNGEYHTYAVPFTTAFTGGDTIYYRKDLAKKYGIGTDGALNDEHELEQYYDAILQNEKGMVPLSFNGAVGDVVTTYIEYIYRPLSDKHNYSGSNGMVIRADGTPYVAKTWIAELDPDYMKEMPAEYQELDPLWKIKKAREWYTKGYLEKDLLSQKSAEDQFKAGKAASYIRGIDTYTDIVQQVASSLPDAELGTFIVDRGLREGVAKQMKSTFQAWNFLAIPTSSKYADRVMQFLDWIYSDTSHHDLIQYGLEGQDWVAEGADKYSVPGGKDLSTLYNFPGFELTWNPNYIRMLSTTPDEVVEVMKKLGDSSFLYKDPGAGFSFNVDSVKAEQAKLNDVGTLQRPLLDGMIDESDMMASIESIQKKSDAAGAQKVRDEMQKQFEAFLQEHPYENQ
ncbi:DUF3502 domain-containing protein [Cohnella fermenti]|uniref:DUF3502 domain-containing protein n=1 Tax=Cohnella fermenti TaxID=2565925 RepID=A0A4S4BI67_9BACL|nr:DUF3502 domain-containing protein [Cohnella fermenti]THF74293.1 DUF3502 domain-containing protein [Cohnella fermenti]